MANINLYIDTDSRKLLFGAGTTQIIDTKSLPFSFGDNPTLNIYLLTKLSASNPVTYKAVPTTGLQLFFYLNDGLISGTIYTQQITWTADAGSTFFTAGLALNTSALQTLIGAATSNTCWIKVGYIQNGSQTTVLSDQVKVDVGLPTTSLVVPAGQTALTAEVASATFLSLAPVNGRGIQLASPSGKIIELLVVDNSDGTTSLQADPVS